MTFPHELARRMIVKFIVAAIALTSFAGCSMTPKKKEAPFTYAGRHLIKIPVKVNDEVDTYFILDTGIGVNLLSTKLSEKYGYKKTHSHTGKRMSGQAIEVPLTTMKSLTVASVRQENVEIAIWNMGDGFLEEGPEFENIEGFLSLNFFKRIPFTMDYRTGTLSIEDEAGLAKRVAAGKIVPIEVRQDGPSLTIFMKLRFPDGEVGLVEIDLGGNILVLDEKHMARMGAKKDSAKTRVEKRRDETNHPYVRYFTEVTGPIAPAAQPDLAQENLKVMFQDIIYDGLVGNDFMKRFTVTYDLPNSRIILGPRD